MCVSSGAVLDRFGSVVHGYRFRSGSYSLSDEEFADEGFSRKESSSGLTWVSGPGEVECSCVEVSEKR